MKTVSASHVLKTYLSPDEIEKFERDTSIVIPSKLKCFYKKYYSLEFDGNMLFEIDQSMEVVRGDEDLEVSVHRTLLFDEIKYVQKIESEDDGYKDYFGDYWKNYLPVIAPLGDNGYFLVGIKHDNKDEVLFLSYTDNTIVKVCSDIFYFFNECLMNY